MNNRPHSREKRVVEKTAKKVEKKEIKNNKERKPSAIRSLLGSLLKK